MQHITLRIPLAYEKRSAFALLQSRDLASLPNHLADILRSRLRDMIMQSIIQARTVLVRKHILQLCKLHILSWSRAIKVKVGLKVNSSP